MKKFLLVAIATILSLPALADDYNLYIVNTSNVKTAYAVSDVQKITFENGNVVVTATDGTTVSTAISAISELYFNTETAESISRLNTDGTFSFDGENITLAHATSTIRVYQASGLLVASLTASDGQPISLSQLPRGIYIVNVDGLNFKIAKR